MFITVCIACLLAGLGFASLAVWLMTRKGNTMKDVLNATSLKDANAIRLELMDKIKISSNIPIVGLFLVGAFVAIGLPAYIAYLQLGPRSPHYLVGNIEDYRQVVNEAMGERVYTYFSRMGVRGDGSFTYHSLAHHRARGGHFRIPIHLTANTPSGHPSFGADN